jgi:tetratricopeptide (TPR) repeat protein
MRPLRTRFVRALTSMMCGFLFVGVVNGQQSPEQVEVATAIKDFFAAYAKADIDGFIRLWSPAAPDLESRRQAMQAAFDNNINIRVNKLEIESIDVRDGNAEAWVRAEIAAEDAKTRKPSETFGKMNRVLRFVHDANDWKVRQYISADEAIADILRTTPTREMRSRLLSERKTWITTELNSVLLRACAREAQGLNPAVAMQLNDLALEVAGIVSPGDKKTLAGIYQCHGGIFLNQNDYPSAREYFQKALDLYKEVGDQADVGRMWHNIASTYSATGRNAEARAALEESLKIARDTNDHPLEAGSLLSIAIQDQQEGKNDDALKTYQKCLKIGRDYKDRQVEAVSLINIGDLYRKTGENRLAVDNYRLALPIFQELNRITGVVNILISLGDVYSHLGDFSKAFEVYEKGRQIASQYKLRAAESRALDEIGVAFAKTGKYGDAVRNIESSRAISHELGNKADELAALINLGATYDTAGDHQDALVTGEMALALAVQTPDKSLEAAVKANLGSAYANEKTFDKALSLFESSLQIHRELGKKQAEAIVRGDIGSVHNDRVELDAALKDYREALAINEEIGDKLGEADMLGRIGSVQSHQGKWAEAKSSYEKSLKIASDIGDTELAAFDYVGFGNIAYGQKDWPSASQAYKNAIAIVEQVRSAAVEGSLKMSVLSKDEAGYHGAVAALVANHNNEDAFQIAEQSKARLLQDVIAAGHGIITKGMTAEEKTKERELNQSLVSANQLLLAFQSQPGSPDRLATLKQAVDNARREYDSFRRELYLKHPNLQGVRAEVAIPSSSNLFDALTNGRTAFLEYVISEQEEKCFAFLLIRHSSNDHPDLTVWTLPVAPKALQDLVGQLQDQIDGNQSEADVASTLRRLYDVLVLPFESQLKGAEDLCVVPDGVLWHVPFAALQLHNDRYLIEKYSLHYAPSLTTLKTILESRRARQPSAELLAMAPFADTSADAKAVKRTIPLWGSYGPLPQSGPETTEIAALFGTHALIQDKASESLVKAEASNFRILHFATHGVYDSANPMYSGILLAPGEGEDGYWEAR